jgi:hypothetical protein
MIFRVISAAHLLFIFGCGFAEASNLSLKSVSSLPAQAEEAVVDGGF